MVKHIYQTLLLEPFDDGLLIVRLNRPHAANAIDTQLGRDLLDVFGALAASDSPYRCVVLTGAGDKHFCSGGDLKERAGFDDAEFFQQHKIFERMILAIIDCPVPVIAAVNGPAFAGGCELVLACDFVYAASNARFALTETSLGIMPGCGGTQNLPRAVGVRRAKELIYSARPFSAQQALEWGLVNGLCDTGRVVDLAMEIGRRICANAPLSVRQAKKAIDLGQRMDLRTALFFEVETYNGLVSTSDRKEGISAFVEKRDPKFSGK